MFDMDLVTALALFAALVLFVAAAVLARRSLTQQPAAWLQERLARKVVVHTTDDRSLAGVLTHVAADGLVLTAAKYLGDKPVSLAGEVYVERARVSFVQLVPADVPMDVPAG